MKPWYQSKTLGVAALSILIFGGTIISQNAGVLNISATTVAWIGVVLSIANAGLRLVTNTAIQGTPGAEVAPVGVPKPVNPR